MCHYYYHHHHRLCHRSRITHTTRTPPLAQHYGWTVEPLLIPLHGSVTEDEARRSISSNCSSGSEILCRGATRDLTLDPPCFRSAVVAITGHTLSNTSPCAILIAFTSPVRARRRGCDTRDSRVIPVIGSLNWGEFGVASIFAVEIGAGSEALPVVHFYFSGE